MILKHIINVVIPDEAAFPLYDRSNSTTRATDSEAKISEWQVQLTSAGMLENN